ncbi:hypothetical protein H1R20_g3375, partial [Candolleomyces eurysporus]
MGSTANFLSERSLPAAIKGWTDEPNLKDLGSRKLSFFMLQDWDLTQSNALRVPSSANYLNQH